MAKPADFLRANSLPDSPAGRAAGLLDECEETLRVLRDCTDSPTQHAIIDDMLAKLRGEA